MPTGIKKIFVFYLTLLVTQVGKSQDVPLSQYYHNLVFTNPAFAGSSSDMRIASFYRNQWPMSESNFKSYGVAYDQSISNYNSGFGLLVLSDNTGVYTSISIDGAFSYRVQLPFNAEVNFGLQAGVTQKYMNSKQLQFEVPEDISGGFNGLYFDFAFGGVSFFNNIYASFAVYHLNKPKVSSNNGESRLNIKFSGQLGYIIEFETSLKKQKRVLMPSVLFQQQGFQQNITWGAVFQYNSIIGGLMVRNNILNYFDVAIFSAGFKTNRLRFAYSYDMNIGKKTSVPLGAHEISLTLLYDKQIKKKHKAIRCPSFLK